MLAICVTIVSIAAGQVPVADPFLEADAPLFVSSDKNYYRLPSLLVTSRGTVLAASQKRLGKSDDFAPSSLVLRRSLDGGKTFEAEQTLFEHRESCTFNGNLIEERQSPNDAFHARFK